MRERESKLRPRPRWEQIDQESKHQVWLAITAGKPLLEKKRLGEELSLEEEKKYLEMEDALAFLISANEGLIRAVAKRVYGQNLFLAKEEDLMQAGRIAIFQKALEYKEEKGEFSTFVYKKILGAVQNAECFDVFEAGVIKDWQRRKRIAILIIKEQELEKKFGRRPTIEELSQATSFRKDGVLSIQEIRRLSVVNFSDLPKDVSRLETNEEMVERIFAEGNDIGDRPVENVALKEVRKDEIIGILEELPEEEREIVYLLSGLDKSSPDGLCQREVGKLFDVTRQMIGYRIKRPPVQKAVRRAVF